MKVLHNLPEKVIFCKECLISNQRPSSSPEFLKKSTNIETVGFKDGVCDACSYFKIKKKIDWNLREIKLWNLCDKYRKNNGDYDVIVPGSGGKDSIFVSHILKHKYKMNPLTVTWAPHIYTEIGWKNFQNWIGAGFDNILITPNRKIHSKLTYLAFKNLLNPFQPFIIGQRNVAPKLAMKYNIKFIMYGENQAEAHNKIEENYSSLMDIMHFCSDDNEYKKNFRLAGMNLENLKKEGINEKDLISYFPIPKKEFKKKEIEVHYMSYFLNWSAQGNYYYAKENASFESNPDGRSEGTYTKYSSLDDKIDGQHYYTMFIKFGQGRAMNDVNRDIREGFISREEGILLLNKYDSEFPKKYFNDFLDYINITEQDYWDIVDSFRSPHLWKKLGNKWELINKII